MGSENDTHHVSTAWIHANQSLELEPSQSMNAKIASTVALGMGLLMPACSTVVPGSQSNAQDNPGASYYGTLGTVRELRDFRKLQETLQDKNMRQVAESLGSPAQVGNFGDSESWTYMNIAFDPATNRLVPELTVWFENGVVDDTRASF